MRLQQGENALKEGNRLNTVTFLGDAPKAGERVFKDATPTIHRKSEAKGGPTLLGVDR